MGRKKIIIDDKKFDVAIGLPLIKADICSLVGDPSEDTLERYCKQRFKLTFAEVQNQKRQNFKKNILAKQYQLALSGDRTMLIWLGKNYCGQKDKFEELDEEELRMERDVMEKLKQIPREMIIQITKRTGHQD